MQKTVWEWAKPFGRMYTVHSRQKKAADFSVVRFRPNFTLASKERPMKSHKNQWVWARPYSGEYLSGATCRGHTMAPEAQTPVQGLDRGRSPRDVGLQTLENKALSRGIIGKSASILADMTIRKSQAAAGWATYYIFKETEHHN